MSKPKVKKLKEFVFSYAYDEPKYCDFRLTAWTLKEAKRKAKEALAEGRFDNVDCDADDSESSHRVFYMDKYGPDYKHLPRMEELCASHS